MNRTRQFTKQLTIESLEPRWLMAGDVMAQAVPIGGDDLVVIVGDNEANQIRVIENAGHISIEGLEGTTVNGKAVDELFSSGDIIFVEIDLGNGDDTLIHEFTGGQFRHATDIDTGNGNDSLAMTVHGIVGLLDIDTGNGNDNVTIDLAPASLLNDGLRMDTGAGDDEVLVKANSVGGLVEWDGFSIIETKQGNDLVRFEGAFGLYDTLSVRLGAGDDTLIGDSEVDRFQRITAVGGPGNDTVLNDSYFLELALFETIIDDD